MLHPLKAINTQNANKHWNHLNKKGQNVEARWTGFHIVCINLLSSPAEHLQLRNLERGNCAPNIAKECAELPCLAAGEKDTHVCTLQSLDFGRFIVICHEHHLQHLRGILDAKGQIVNVVLSVLQMHSHGGTIAQSLLAQL